ncbi:helix-turn-helix transcriptional regulator [Kiloniella sp.]|uniref:helix-turn-helix transcriptional regulator n=1 Tax=Kiloniella sp. TaxID=1938587 RepID=UPI003A8CEBBB
MQFSDREYSVEDLRIFSEHLKLNVEDLTITRSDKAVDLETGLINGCFRESKILPGLTVCTLKGAILGEYNVEATNPPGLSLYIGFEGSGHTKQGENTIEHKTAPKIYYLFHESLLTIKQVSFPGNIETVVIHFALDELKLFIEEYCLNNGEKDRLNTYLLAGRDYKVWCPNPSITEALKGLVCTELTGINLRLHFIQVVVEVLKSFFTHLLQRNKIQSEEQVVLAKDVRHVDKAVEFIKSNMGKKLTLQAIADEVGCSKKHLKLNFPKICGYPPAHYVLRTRMEVAKNMLRSGRATIQQTAAHVGYANQASFTTAFRKYHKITPSEATSAAL